MTTITRIPARQIPTASRLASDDRARARERVQGMRKQWRKTYKPRWSDLPAAERVAWHALGCSQHDLRDSELAELRSIALDVLGLTAAG